MIALTKIRELDIAAEHGGLQSSHISAASGLVCVGSTLYVIADDELYLGIFSAATQEPGHLVRLLEGALPDGRAERKRQKPDFEALALLPALQDFPQGALLALSSGSRTNRCRGVLLGLDRNGGVRGSSYELDMSPIFNRLHDVFSELNIEGAAVVGSELRLLQRGNKRHPENAIVHYSLSRILDAVRSASSDVIEPDVINRLDLGSIDGIPFCFTDASALPNGDMVFCAVAEDTDDAYRDGPCNGAVIGIIDNGGKIPFLQRLERPYKVEGISARSDGDRLDLLLVTDADDPAIPAMLLSASITR